MENYEMIKIEKNVPITKKEVGRGISSPVSKAITEMEIGDSFVLTSQNYKSYDVATRSAHVLAKKHGVKVTVRGEKRHEDHWKIRVWRVS
jgi:ATP-dependent RNA circularization protein (DNA/RNA ligase family)